MVGSDEIWSIERIYLKYLQQLGFDAELFAAQSFFINYYRKNLLNKLFFKAGISNIFSSINEQLKKKAAEFKPDIIWVFKGMEIYPETIDELKKAGNKVANYNPDNPFIFSGSGSGNKNVTNSISRFDLHFTYNNEIKEKLEMAYQCRVAYLPFGFELNTCLYQECAAQQEMVKLCFVGNPDKERALFINNLVDCGIEIDIYGNDWEKFINHSKVSLFKPVYNNEFWKVLRKYRVQLNLMRMHNKNSHNMRSFEIPGVGGIMIAPETPEHRLFFKDNEEAFFFTDLDDCIRKINYILHISGEDADKIRTNARNRSVNSGYSYKDRADIVLKSFKVLISNGRSGL
ncbi:MAG TPA: glycosyltransferase [Puia sp.]|nr:glycosyltransferase [Puia sp.]